MRFSNVRQLLADFQFIPSSSLDFQVALNLDETAPLKGDYNGRGITWTPGPWTPSMDRVHGPLSWTRSMAQVHGPPIFPPSKSVNLSVDRPT